jgi:ABC-2 type transport system permease protein
MRWWTSSRRRPSSRRSSSTCTARTATEAELLTRELRDHRRSLAGWCAGVAVYVLAIAAIFPSIKGSPSITNLLDQYPEAVKSLFGLAGGVDIGSGAGFVDAELFSFILPLFVIALAIGSGARTLAGEEDAGRLELVFAYPVTRRAAVLEKGSAVGLEVLGFCVVAFASLGIASPIFDLGLSFERLTGAIVGLGLLALLHGWLALTVGAVWPSRAAAIGIPAALAAAGYLIGGLHSLASWLDPLRFVSSFWWIGQSPLSNGVDWWRFLVVAGVAAVALLAASWLIGRRDLETP